MELIILGIDAGDERIINAMDMPNLKSVLSGNHTYNAIEDLSSRGWAEMLSGKNGRETGAFYAKPKLDGTRDCTLTFDTHDYEKHPEVKPLWRLINEAGKTLGFMNIPTTKFAPEVDGFFVSGAGGGLAGVSGIPEEFCFPKDMAGDLNDLGYIIDTRLLSSGIKDMDEWLERLKQTIQKRTECYIHLQKKYKTDIGFIVYIATCRMQYIAMSEIEEMIENKGKPSNELQEKIADLYRYFDNQIGILLRQLKPQYVMAVSDHGQSIYHFDVNVNYFLRREGLWNNTKEDKAFGMFYTSGIFINDDRFEGVVTEADKDSLTDKIIDAFNRSGEAKIYGMKARGYRSLHMEAKCSELLPDIWIDAPDSIFFLPWSNRFIRMNSAYGNIRSLKKVTNEMYTGIKSQKALMSIPFEYTGIPEDLTGVYEIIKKYLESSGKEGVGCLTKKLL